MTRRFAESSDWPADPSLVGGPSLLASMWRRRYVLAASALAALALGYVLSSMQTPVYSATATVFLTDPSDANLFGRDTADPERHVQQQASRMQSRTVFEGAARTVPGDVGPDEIASRVGIAGDAQVGLITVTATAGTADAAAGFANAVVDSYEQISRDAAAEDLDAASAAMNEQTTQLQEQAEELRTQLEDNPENIAAAGAFDAVQAQLAALRTRMSEVATEVAVHGAGIDSIEEARPPQLPSSPKPVRDALVASMLGAAIASAYVYWRAGAAHTALTNVSDLLGAPVLAQIPEFRRVGTTHAELLFDTQAIEAYQFLVSSLEYSLSQAEDKSLLVTSASPGEGKSLTALHLARALTTQGREVVLVDSSFRAQELSALLRATDHAGLAELAAGSSLDDVVYSYRLSQHVRLSFVPTGRLSSPPTGLLSTPAYQNAIAKIINAYDVVIIDGEPLLTVADVSSIARAVAGIVLVIDADTSNEALIQVKERLRFVATPLLGYVANRVSPSAGFGPFTERVDGPAHGQNGDERDAASLETVPKQRPHQLLRNGRTRMFNLSRRSS